MSGLRKLLIMKSPKPDESFLGYILRLTELNDYETPSWILQLAHIGDYLQAREFFVFDNTLNLAPLSRLTGVQENELRALAYQPVESVSSKHGKYFIFGSAISRGLINLYPAKVCPDCINESGYIRKIWELTSITACPKHRRLLLDECPNCLCKIRWSRKRLNICQCDYDWTTYSYDPIDESELRVTNRIHAICKLPASPAHSSQEQSSNPLYGLDLQSLSSALFFIASQSGRITYGNGKAHVDTTGGFFASSMNNREIHVLLYKALLVFDDWPNRFFSFLEWIRSNSKDRKHFTGIARDFGAYREGIYRKLAASSLDFIRVTFQEYIATKWHGGYLAHVKRVEEHQREKKKYVSKAEAGRLLNISSRRIESLIRDNQLEAIVHPRGRFIMTLISKESLLCLKRELEYLITKEQAVILLQAPYIDLKSLVGYKLLNLHQHPVVSSNPIRFCLREIQDLMAQLESKVLIKRYKRSEISLISLSQVSNYVSNKHLRMGDFVKGVLDGDINPCKVERSLWLKGVFFYKADILNFAQKVGKRPPQTLKRSLGIITLEETAKILGLSTHSVWSLIKKGILFYKTIVVRGSLTKGILRSDIEHFISAYVPLAPIAKNLKTAGCCLVKLLAKENVHATSGPSIDNTPLYIFKRSDIESINLEILLNAHRQTKRQKKRERKLVGFNEASDILKISKKRVEMLIKDGILRPSNVRPKFKHSDEERFFYRSAVENISGRLGEYEGLVSANIAARILSIKTKSLYTKYVLTGRLKVQLDEGKRRKQYFLRRDVDAQVLLEERTIKSPEAATLLEVSPATIHRMVISRRLKPISGPNVDGYRINSFLRSDVEKLHKV